MSSLASGWAPKRFWTAAGVSPVESGYAIDLDGWPVKTPLRRPLVVPRRALADRIAGEWDAQEGQIKPEEMPFTRSANAAIDKVADQFGEVAGLISAYGDSDLLCYRATEPETLVERQRAAWDPVLRWAHEAFGVKLAERRGVMHRPQDNGDLARLRGRVDQMTNFELTGFHDLVSLSGSLILGFAVAREHLAPDDAWTRAQVDETWQIEQWGVDEEAAQMAVFFAETWQIEQWGVDEEAAQMAEMVRAEAPGIPAFGRFFCGSPLEMG